VYWDTTNVEPEMYDCTSNNWSHWNSNEKLKEKFVSCTRKTFDSFTTKDSYTWNITLNTESTSVWCSVKLEAWAVGFTAGSREVPGRKGLWQKKSISYNNNNNNNNNNTLLKHTIIFSESNSFVSRKNDFVLDLKNSTNLKLPYTRRRRKWHRKWHFHQIYNARLCVSARFNLAQTRCI
jgi:hypothetical protein